MFSISQSLKSFCPWASCPARAEISKKSVPWANIQNVAGCKTTSQNHTVNREISSKALTASICQQCLNTKSTQTYKIILFDLWTSAWSIIFRILSRTKNFPLLRCSFTASDVLMRKFRSGRSSFWKSSIGYEVICVKESEIITEAPFSFPIFSPIQVLLVTFFAIHVKLHLQRMCQGARSEPPWVTSSSLLRIDVNSDYHLLMCLQTLKYLYFQHDGNVLKFRIKHSFTWDEQHLCAPLKVCNHCHVDLTPFLKDRVIVFGFAPARFRECSFFRTFLQSLPTTWRRPENWSIINLFFRTSVGEPGTFEALKMYKMSFHPWVYGRYSEGWWCLALISSKGVVAKKDHHHITDIYLCI